MESQDKRNKASKGKRKIEIKRIEQKSSRLVTFSKRRAGIFKKASELSMLCGAEVAVLVRSPAGRVFGFGYPSIEAVIQRYENRDAAGDRPEYCDEWVGKVQRATEENRHIDGMGLEELTEFRNALEGLRNETEKKAKEMAIKPGFSSSSHEEQHENVVPLSVDESNLLFPRSSDFRLWSY
nr:agamous-like MADS-box protein AGL62 [Ipomoea batatas]